MAKKQAKNLPGGPYLIAAFFCERTLQEKDESVSAIRMIDRITIFLDPATVEPDFPSEKKRLPVSVNGLVSFKTGGSPGEHTVRCELVSPSGKVNPEAFKQTYVFSDDPIAGVNVHLNSTIRIKKGGLFKMNVYLDDRFYTQVPLEITVKRLEGPLAETGSLPQGVKGELISF